MLSASDATRYAKPAGSTKPIAYGTAGFRARAETLESTFYRMGMLAVLRSRSRGGRAVGLMVTASHNAEPDNGIKLIDTDGGMLHQSGRACDAARGRRAGELPAVLAAVAAETATAEAWAAWLSSAAHAAALGGPRRHCARGRRGGGRHRRRLRRPHDAAAPPPRAHAQRRGGRRAARRPGGRRGVGVGGRLLRDGREALCRSSAPPAPAPPPPRASRCGSTRRAASARRRSTRWSRRSAGLELTLANKVGDGPLNDGCGAEWVQKGRTPPRAESAAALGNCARACSLDGDADRIVFLTTIVIPGGGCSTATDAALCVSWVSELLGDLKLATPLTMAAVRPRAPTARRRTCAPSPA